MRRPTVFISYSHEDEAWKERVSTHLAVLHDSLMAWDDSHIETGADWRAELEQAISDAGAAVLLISAHFLSSRFILEEEVPRLLQRRADSGLHLMPLLLSPCDWEAAGWLQRLQLRPRGARALSEQSRHAIDGELASLAKELRLLTSGSVQEAVPAPFLPGPVDVSISRLPLSGAQLFGRERELALLDGAWADPDTHVISLVAWGGVGKSSLVNQWLGKLAMNRYRGAHRVYGWSFFSQGQRNTAALANDFLSEALKRMGDPTPAQGSIWERGERLARYIQQERMLLILDGLEPLQAHPGPTWGRLKEPGLSVLVRELAFFNPGLCVITSRIRVTDIEHFRNTTAPIIELEGLSEEAGAELLRSLGVSGSQEELQQASREFGGHSLALNLLGTYLSNACNGDIRVRSELHIFEEGLEEGQQAEAMLQSYEAWFGEERPELAVLRMLGLFDRPVESEWMDALLEPPAIPGLTAPLVGLSEPAWQRVLSHLRQAQLMAKASAPNLDVLDTHPLVRAYFGHQLKARLPEAWKQGNDRLYEYFASQARSLSPTSEARGPLQLAIAHGCRAGRHVEVFEQLFLKRLVRGTDLSMLGAQGFDRASEFLAALAHFFEPPWRRPAAVFSDELKLQVHWTAAELLMYLGRIPEAVEPLLGALDNPRLHDHPHQAAHVFGDLCRVYVFLGELERAVQYGERAVELSRETGVAWQQSRQLANLAWALAQCGRSAEAEELFLRAASLPLGEDWVHFLSGDLMYCDLLLDQGRFQEVFRRLGPYVEWARSSGIRQLMGMLQLSLGMAHLRRSAEAPEALGLALEFLSEGILLMRKLGTPMLMTPALTSRAAVHRLRGSFKLAWRDLGEALFISTGAGTRLYQVDLRLERCRLFLAMRKLAQSRSELGAARKLLLQRGYHRRDRELAELIALVGTPSMLSVGPGPSPSPRG